MKKSNNIMTLTCLKATELIEKSIENKLSFFEKIRLSFHLKLCKACQNYSKHSHQLDEALTGNASEFKAAEINLDDLKNKIINKIEKK